MEGYPEPFPEPSPTLLWHVDTAGCGEEGLVGEEDGEEG